MRRALQLLAGALLLVGLALIAVPATPLAKETPRSAPIIAAPKLPATIQGLGVTGEDIHKTLTEDRRTLYLNGVWLYSLRQGKELMATLEIGKFTSGAPWQNGDFDLSLAGQLGNSLPAVARLDGGVPVYVTTARGLVIAAWFRHGYMTILAIRSTYKTPKDLLRAALEASP